MGHTRRPIASHDPDKAEPHPQPQHTCRLLLCGLPPPPPRLKASPRLPAWLATSHSHRTAPRRICFTTRLPHHGCLTPRSPPFQPAAVLAQDPRIAPATAVLRRALLRKWHPTIITPNGPASPAAPTLAASHHGPGRADEHGGAEEIRQRCPSQLPPTGPQQHLMAQRQSQRQSQGTQLTLPQRQEAR